MATTATTAAPSRGRTPGFRPRKDPLPALRHIEHSPLLAVAAQLMALEDDLRRIQPSLALRPVRLDRQVLTVTAESAAVAARVRQFEPSLLAGLRARGWLVNKVRFRAGSALALGAGGKANAAAPERPGKAPVGDRAIAAVAQLHATLTAAGRERAGTANPATEAGGESPFCAALGDFVARQRSYRR